MGKRGPTKTPTNILKLRGSPHANTRTDEPEPETGVPAKPELSERAAEVWAQVVKLTSDMGVLTVADGAALARYCELVVRWVDVAAFLAKHGETYTVFAYHHGKPLLDEQGRKVIQAIKRFPQTAIADSLATQLLRIEQHYGLTPSARAGLEVEAVVRKGPSARKRNA